MQMEFVVTLDDIRLFQWIAMITAASLGIVMLLIKVPHTEHATKLTRAKSLVAIDYLFCAFIFGYTLGHQHIDGYEVFSALMMLINVAFSTTTIAFSLINLLSYRYVDFSKLLISIFAMAIVSIGLIEIFFKGETDILNITLIASIVLFAALCIYYIIIFDKWYKHSILMLEKYYDEDEEHKLKWVKFCFILAMLTEMVVIVYLLFFRDFMFIYIGFYILFLLYFAGNFISFLGSHKLLLDAFGHYAISQAGKSTRKRKNPRKRKKEVPAIRQEESFDKIREALSAWAEQKKYREYDKSREEIAAEIGTTKEMLNLYFTQEMGKDFRTWRTELRIEDAKQILLENKKVSTNIVGEMVGFSDRSNFHRQFTKIVGCSPKHWRDTDGSSTSDGTVAVSR